MHTRGRAMFELATDDAGGARVVALHGRALPADLTQALTAAREAADDERQALASASAAAARVRSSVQELRAGGASWTVIGHALGITRGAAQKRYGDDRLL
ncbi:hypothetical protein [Cellulomonas sp. Y8]|uniref:hypothetical protein n=1 Tax=Cellulomonas sp. Y8 TaxID=2591145 RepID=UPI003D72B428